MKNGPVQLFLKLRCIYIKLNSYFSFDIYVDRVAQWLDCSMIGDSSSMIGESLIPGLIPVWGWEIFSDLVLKHLAVNKLLCLDIFSS